MADCPHIPEMDYGDYNKNIQEKVQRAHIPMACGIELTYRCNLKCAHCYIDQDAGKNELSREEISNILDQAAAEGTLWLLMTGGEPFARKDFVDIYLDAKKKGFLITLFTNATTITEEIADMLAEWPPYIIETTLYGASKEVYEAVTQVPGSYDKFVKGVDLLLERGLKMRMKSMVLTLNKHELEDMKKFAKERDCNFRFDAMVNPKLDGSKKPLKVTLSAEEVVDLDEIDTDRLEAWQEFAKDFKRMGKNEYVFTCGAGTQSFHISPHGEMSVCILAREPNYDLRKGTIKEGWHEFMPKVRSMKNKCNYRCSECEIIVLCGQCPGWAKVEHDELEKPVEFLCKVAHLRAKAFGIKIDTEPVTDEELVK